MFDAEQSLPKVSHKRRKAVDQFKFANWKHFNFYDQGEYQQPNINNVLDASKQSTMLRNLPLGRVNSSKPVGLKYPLTALLHVVFVLFLVVFKKKWGHFCC